MTLPPLALGPDDWLRIRDALRYAARDLHHRSFAVNAPRRALLWEEMDRCLALADRIAACQQQGGGQAGSEAGSEAAASGLS